jgi:hypothetical protein
MGGEHDVWPRLPADALTDDVAGAIETNVLQAARLQQVQYDRGARPFAERRRRNFTQSHLIVDRGLLRSASSVDRRLNADIRRLRRGDPLRSGVALCRHDRDDHRQHRS